jgi:hypothetical protein
MRLLRACVAVTLWLLVSSAQAAAPPKDHIRPSKPTVDLASVAGVLRPTFQFGARDNRTPAASLAQKPHGGIAKPGGSSWTGP